MKRISPGNRIGLILSLMAFFMLCGTAWAAAEADDAPAEWTVMFYFCGSDLESKYGYASGNLQEIGYVEKPYSDLANIAEIYGVEIDAAAVRQPGAVNVLIETGGSREWHAGNLGIDIDAGRLQRWRYECYTDEERYVEGLDNGFTLVEELPLKSMADPSTLSDFIRWASGAFPAKRYALVLWDHGGGSKTGILRDELFDGDFMTLAALREALAGGGVRLEAVLFDACLMANLETACAVREYADWMIASEEIVPGTGTAVEDWLQQLMYNPECDGKHLGRIICDTTQIKYGGTEDEQERMLLTWSVIDLSEIGRMEAVFDRFFEMIGTACARYPMLMSIYARTIGGSQEYGYGEENMVDLADVFYDKSMWSTLDVELRRDALNALADAVAYCVRGPGRSTSRGLSFCYAVDFGPEELDVYAENCPSLHYLAFLDSISDWTAPDEVYRFADRLPEMDANDGYRQILEKRVSSDGMPGISVEGELNNIDDICYRLYRYDEEADQVVCLGSLPAFYASTDDEEPLQCADVVWEWPAVEGVYCSMEMVSMNYGTMLSNIPVSINGQIWNLRCSKDEEGYSIHGLWEGYDDDNDMPDRNVRSLSAFAGQEYTLLYPIDGGIGGRISYQAGESMTMYRALEVTTRTLPAGTYYLEYVVLDMFRRPKALERIEMRWDGENMTFPEGFKWEGTVVLNPPKD